MTPIATRKHDVIAYKPRFSFHVLRKRKENLTFNPWKY